MENVLEGCPCCLWYHLSAVCKIREEWNWKETWAETEEQPERKMGRCGHTPSSEMETDRQRGRN